MKLFKDIILQKNILKTVYIRNVLRSLGCFNQNVEESSLISGVSRGPYLDKYPGGNYIDWQIIMHIKRRLYDL